MTTLDVTACIAKGLAEPFLAAYCRRAEREAYEERMRTMPHDTRFYDVEEELAALYQAYYKVDNDPVRYRMEVEEALARLMMAYNTYLE